jgi:hypothetical protein
VFFSHENIKPLNNDLHLKCKGFASRDSESHKKPVRKAGILVKIQREHLPNTSLRVLSLNEPVQYK